MSATTCKHATCARCHDELSGGVYRVALGDIPGRPVMALCLECAPEDAVAWTGRPCEGSDCPLVVYQERHGEHVGCCDSHRAYARKQHQREPWKPRPRLCVNPTCRTVFVPSRVDRTTCSEDCRKVMDAARKRRARGGTLLCECERRSAWLWLDEDDATPLCPKCFKPIRPRSRRRAAHPSDLDREVSAVVRSIFAEGAGRTARRFGSAPWRIGRPAVARGGVR